MIQKLLNWIGNHMLRNMDVGIYPSAMGLIALLRYPVKMKVFTQTFSDLSAALLFVRDTEEIRKIYQSLKDLYGSIFGPKREEQLFAFLGFMEENYPFLAKGGEA